MVLHNVPEDVCATTAVRVSFASQGDAAMVELLLEHGGAQQRAGQLLVWGLTEIMLAVVGIDFDVVEVLAQHGADAHARSAYGQVRM